MRQNFSYNSTMRIFFLFAIMFLSILNGFAQEIDFNSNSQRQLSITFQSENKLITLINFNLSANEFSFSSTNSQVQSLLAAQNLSISNNELDLSSISITDQYNLEVTYTGQISPLPNIFTNNKFTLSINNTNGNSSNNSNGNSNNDTNGSQNSSFSRSQIQSAARNKLTNDPNFDIEKFYNNDLGIYLEKNVVHVFLDQNGNFIETAIPTTATEKYIYQFHIFQEKQSFDDYSFMFSWQGRYTPTFNMERGGEDVDEAQSSEIANASPDMVMLSFEKIGPFTENFKVKMERINKDNKVDKVLIDQNIKVAKLYHVSISTGLISTTLRDPQNIQTFALPNGDSTLIADDPSLRGVVTLFATYYPKGRSFLLTPSGNLFDPSRFAIQVGAQLNSNLAENFFLGLSHDFARGGSFSYGAHFGRRNYVAGKPDFNFGTDIFDLNELVIKKEWSYGFYFGVVIDVRVAFQLLGALGNPQIQ